MLSRGLPDHFRIGILILLPVLAFMQVTGRKLPVLVRIVDPLQQAPGLFCFGQMQEDLDDDDAVFMHILFKIAQLAIAVLPDVLAEHRLWQVLAVHQVMDLDDKDFFIIGAIENGDIAAFGQMLMAAPEIVMVQLLGRRHLEWCDFNPLGIEAAHDMLDGPILAGSVHGLQNNEHPEFIVGIKDILELDEGLNIAGQFRLGFRALGPAAGLVRGKISQPEPFGVTDPEILDFHNRSLLWRSGPQVRFHVSRTTILCKISTAESRKADASLI